MGLKSAKIECNDPNQGSLLPNYLLDALDDTDVERFEDHLMNCEYCRQQVVEATPAIHVIRELREPIAEQMVRESAGFDAEVARLRRRSGWVKSLADPLRWIGDWLGGAVKNPYLRYGLATAAVVVLTIMTRVWTLFGPSPAPPELVMQYPWDTSNVVPPPDTLSPPPLEPPIARWDPSTLLAVKVFTYDSMMNRTAGGSVDPLYEEAMRFYAQGQYGKAAGGLKKYVDSRKGKLGRRDYDQHALVYLGVSRLMQNHPTEAAAALKPALKIGRGPIDREEILHYLAAADLKRRSIPEAVAYLDTLRSSGGKYAEQARQTLDSLRVRGVLDN